MVTAVDRAETLQDTSQVQPGYGQDIELVLPECWSFTLEAFIELAAENDNIRFERTREGHLLIMAPTGMESAYSSGDVFTDLSLWTREHYGMAIPPDAAIVLPDKSVLSPDAAWLDEEQAEHFWSLSKDERGKPGAFVPAFIVEVRSPSQSVRKQREKMERWMSNGVRLCWLVDPLGQDVYIYRPGQEAERLHRPETLSGEGVLEGFEMSCERLWR